MLDFDERYMVRKSYYVTGTKKMGTVLNAGAITLNGDGTVTMACTGHGLPVGTEIRIAGSVAYNDYFTLTAVTANTFTFAATETAETMGGTETVEIVLHPDELFRLLEIRLHLDTASAQADNLTITVDSGENAVYDCVIITQDTNGLADFPYCWGKGACHHMKATDALIFAWANKDNRTWGLEVVYDVIQAD